MSWIAECIQQYVKHIIDGDFIGFKNLISSSKDKS